MYKKSFLMMSTTFKHGQNALKNLKQNACTVWVAVLKFLLISQHNFIGKMFALFFIVMHLDKNNNFYWQYSWQLFLYLYGWRLFWPLFKLIIVLAGKLTKISSFIKIGNKLLGKYAYFRLQVVLNVEHCFHW